MRFAIASLLAVLAASGAATVTGVATPTTTLLRPLNPDPSVLQLSNSSDIAARAPSPRPAAHLTNAKRIALGLPPNKPHRRNTRASHARRSATPPLS